MLETVSSHRCFGGTQAFLRHRSEATGTTMRLAVFTPPGEGPFPVLFFLAGLTCTEENFTVKAGAQRAAAALGLMLVAPDTSPRGEGVADSPDYDLGQGAGFYVDATEAPWVPHYRMWTYVTEELPALVATLPQADMTRQGLSGHSMGGHGALTVALRRPGRFRSVSAFAPIVAPIHSPWGRKAFTAYLGADEAAWRAHDACALIEDGARVPELLVDQGEADQWIEGHLKPERLVRACEAAGIPLTMRMQPGYDHGYFFVASFIDDHLRWHAERLR